LALETGKSIFTEKLSVVCIARLKSELNSHKLKPSVRVRWGEIISEQEASGIIERAPLVPTGKVVHYLPHRPIEQGSKVRVVQDASAKTKSGQSLNDALYAGPSMIQSLVGMLINFRMFDVGLSADIEKAFHMVGLDVADRDSVRFLWVEDPTRPIDDQKLVVFRFTRVPFGVISSPFLLHRVLHEIFNKDANNPWYQLVNNKFYVDNLVLSVDSVVDAVQLSKSVTSGLASAGFNLRDWCSNSLEFERSLSPEMALAKKDEFISILGMLWNRRLDSLSLKFDELKVPSSANLSAALSALATVFDPCGLFSPCLLPLKIFIRDCWKLKVSWNDILPTLYEIRFRKLVVERNLLKEISISRKLWPSINTKYEIEHHIFCDASKQAYGCSHYLLRKSSDGRTHSCLIFAKARLAPPSGRTIPQLELMAVVIGIRTASFIRKELCCTVSRTMFWTDNTSVIQWLNSAKIQPPFVQNRLTEIRKHQNICLKYVPTEDNPADIVTKGKRPQALESETLWWQGPKWLICESLWPASPAGAPMYEAPAHVVTLLTQLDVETHGLAENFEFWFSIWSKYVRFTYYCLLWTLRRFPADRWPFSKSEGLLLAERVLLHKLQKKYFAQELMQLQNNVPNKSRLPLFLASDGLIHCQTRLVNAVMDWESSHPILLPRKSRIAYVILDTLHRENAHLGVSHLIAKLRERFWIPKVRPLASSVIHNCFICKRVSGGAYQLPPMPPLPLVRVADVAPFLHTGVDYFGPLYVDGVLPHFPPRKVYVALFTCLVFRAVHLELVNDKSGSEFVEALVRFSSVRRLPKFILSDNGTNFTAVQPLVGRSVQITDPVINNFLSSNYIEWHFIPPYRPWYGGVYERLVGVVKISLFKAFINRLLPADTLRTALYYVMDIINSRPLTSVPSDELIEVLTPNHFLRLGGANVNAQLEISLDTDPPTASRITLAYSKVRAVVASYCDAFRSLYFSFLKETQATHHRHPRGSLPLRPKVGDVVLVKELDSSRPSWPCGVVTQVDARQGEAQVRTIQRVTSLNRPTLHGSVQIRLSLVPINRLYPLEIAVSEPVVSSLELPVASTSM
jgi:hypothetical protein